MGIALSETPNLFGIYSDPARDKRRHIASAVFVAHIPPDAKPYAGDDAKGVIKKSWDEILKSDNFFDDHKTILLDYYYKVKAPQQRQEVSGAWDKFSRSIC